MGMDLQGKGVFLTGGAMGIGKAVLEALLARGAKVLFCDVNEEAGLATRKELLETYPESDVIFVKCDVSDATQLTETFQKAVSEFGAVDICINNAAIMDERIWEKMISVNQVAVIRGSLLALEHMRRDKSGHGGVIINTSSVNGLLYGQSLFPVYMATKRAIVGFTTSWANSPDQPQHGVRWGVVCPDSTVTPIHDNIEGRLFFPPPKTDGKHQPKDSGKSKWLSPADVALAFLTLLDNVDSNGYVIKVFRDRELENPPVVQSILVMDKSSNPVESLIEKKAIVTPPTALQ